MIINNKKTLGQNDNFSCYFQTFKTLMMLLSSCFMENVFYVIQHFVYTCWQTKYYRNYHWDYFLSEIRYFSVHKKEVFFFKKKIKHKHYAPLWYIHTKNGSNYKNISSYTTISIRLFENLYEELNYLISKDNLLSLLFSLPTWSEQNNGDNENMPSFYEFWQSETLNLLVQCRSFILNYFDSKIMQLNKDRKCSIKIFFNFLLHFFFICSSERKRILYLLFLKQSIIEFALFF